MEKLFKYLFVLFFAAVTGFYGLHRPPQIIHIAATDPFPTSLPFLHAGDKVLFERGGRWTATQTLVFYCLGVDNNYDDIEIGAYGTGATPIIETKATVPNNWTAYRGDTVWRATVPFTFQSNSRLWINGVEQPRAFFDYAGGSYIDSVNRFQVYTDNWHAPGNTNAILLYSPHVNPVTYYGSDIKFCGEPSSVFEIDYNGWTLQNLDIRGGTVNTVQVINGVKATVRNCTIGIDAAHGGLNFQGIQGLRLYNCEINSGDQLKTRNLFQDGVGDGLGFGYGAHDVDCYNLLIKNWGHSCFEILTLGSQLYSYMYNSNGLLYSNFKFHDNICTAPDVDYCRGFAIDITADAGDLMIGRHEIWIYRNLFTDLHVQSQADGEGTVIAYNIFNHTKNPETIDIYPDLDRGWAIAINGYNGTTGRRQWIIGNTFINNESGGIDLSGSNSSAGYGDIVGNEITNNLFINNGWKGNREVSMGHVNGTQIMIEPYATGGTKGNTIKNNMFLTQYPNNFFFNGFYSSGNRLRTFANFAANAQADLTSQTGYAWTISGNIYSDPLLNSDYTLPINSPARNAGLNLSDYSLPDAIRAGRTWLTDALTVPNTNWDLGAFPYYVPTVIPPIQNFIFNKHSKIVTQ